MGEAMNPGVQRVYVVDSAGAAATLAGAVGAGTAAAATRITSASDDPVLTAIGEVQASPTANTLLDRLKTLATSLTTMIASLAQIKKSTQGEFETVAASQTAQVLGATGAAGDYISHLVITPETTAPGVVTLLDGAISIALWLGGTVGADLKPFTIDLRMVSASGAWKVTTGANVHVIGVGDFT